jgi:hypothetical protein
MTKPHSKIIKEFAAYFDQELQTTLPISVLPNGSLVYKNFLVTQLDNQRWGLYNMITKELVNDYFLKSASLIAAKAYQNRHYNQYYEINDLDRMYKISVNDSVVFQHVIDNTTDSEKYHITLTRLEESNAQSQYYRQMILRLFRLSFI